MVSDEAGPGPRLLTGASVTADFVRVERTLPPGQVAASSSAPAERDAPSEATFLPGGFLKHYEIIRKLGEGGMGVVLLARDTKLGRLVAIKLLRDRGQATSRLLAEARATALCKHESIVVLYDVDETDGHPYMVLEYLEGRTLREVLSSGPRGSSRALPKGLALDIVTSVLRALIAAHERGVVHRDLKPENIMILDAGGIKVLDFGLARRGDGLEPIDGGTLAYMAPEQWSGEEVDARADLWAVGVLLYELLAGAHPLAPLTRERAESVSDLDVPMPRLCDVMPELSALSDVVDRCLRKRKEERFASADELLAALTPLREGRKLLALAEGELPSAGLCGARLLLLEVGGLPGAVTVEFVHASSIERWPRLARWLDESTADAEFMARQRAAASQWRAEARRRRQRSIAGAFVVLGIVSVLVFFLAMRAQAQARRADASGLHGGMPVYAAAKFEPSHATGAR
ncbi:serine/threonine-protein kinase [Polyangium mundeleinium]|uniref:Serine/threonine-protein kinase n=1 Tax=Polyangium mundeleinium TaxID=2995306 RepID=A0ABT5ET76_9BACT|nr:serine/threonine-protein kinase [Polyangium mundeleinium]MDC0744117.1 serine/threonine-protein kinase [Polyangium mundeleinium]